MGVLFPQRDDNMKKFTCLLIVAAFMFSINLLAESSKLTKVDLDVKTTQIVRAELDIDDFHYYIDTNACICWLSRLIGGSPAVAIVDCAKLAAHPKLEQYVSKCLAKPVAEVKKEKIAVESKKNKKDKDIKEVKKDSDKVLEDVMDNKTTPDAK